MNASCPHCNTVFRLDPAKIPQGGVRARCSICRGVFAVERATESASGPGAAEWSEGGDSRAPVEAVAGSALSGSTGASAGFAPPAPPEIPEPEPVAPPREEMLPPAIPEPSAPAPQPRETAPTASPPPSPFGASDPKSKARRLARALVSDIVTYHPERRDAAIQEGTLKREFKEEIKKSWEEYVGQVGTEIAHGTTYFRDALNDILARGQKVF